MCHFPISLAIGTVLSSSTLRQKKVSCLFPLPAVATPRISTYDTMAPSEAGDAAPPAETKDEEKAPETNEEEEAPKLTTVDDYTSPEELAEALAGEKLEEWKLPTFDSRNSLGDPNDVEREARRLMVLKS
jgi:hypothetical protein